jgi:hypothetical protein
MPVRARYVPVVPVVACPVFAGQSLIMCSACVAFDHDCNGQGSYTVDLCSGAHWPLHTADPQGVG